MPANPDERSYLVRFGPYYPPRIRVGDEIHCEIRGTVAVVDWSDRGEIMWPRCRTSRRFALIVTGDLVRAMANETELAVARLWGVAPHTVMKWKRALEIPARTPGTEIISAEKARESMTGRTAAPRTKAALLRAASRAKSKEWRRKIAAINKLRLVNTPGLAMTVNDTDYLCQILEARIAGQSYAEIGKIRGVSRQAVQCMIARLTTRRRRIKSKSFATPRCDCGLWSLQYARRIGHQCDMTRADVAIAQLLKRALNEGHK